MYGLNILSRTIVCRQLELDKTSISLTDVNIFLTTKPRKIYAPVMC